MGTGVRRSSRRIGAFAVVLMGGLLAMTGCGSSKFTYVANQDTKTYFKVPSAWTQVDPAPADAFFAARLFGAPSAESAKAVLFSRVSWSTMYDASKEPSGEDLFTPYPTTEPVAYALVVPMTTALQKELSFDLLRNLVDPVTADVRTYLAQNNPQALPGDFELLDDQTLTPSPGLHGIRVVYNQAMGLGYLHTFDLTALTNDDSSVLYAILVRCTASCYRERAVEINDIVTSFTVRSKA